MKFLLMFLISLTAFAKPKNEIRVMIIDGGIGRNKMLEPYVQYRNTDDYVDMFDGHGTHVTGIVLYGNKELNDPVCLEVKVFSCKGFNGGLGEMTTGGCVKRAIKMKVQFINMSGGGIVPVEEEHQALIEFGNSGGTATVAVGNEAKDISKYPFYYPASYEDIPNMIRVQNRGRDGKLSKLSNWHPLAVMEDGEEILSTLPDNEFGRKTGTSMAAPAVLHYLLKKKCANLLQ